MNTRLFVAGCLAMLAFGAGAAEEHGKTDVYSTPGATLAWAVARGPDEARTFIVIRVAFDVGINRHFTVTGRDPFSNAERAWPVKALSSGRAEVRIPRADFVEHPRTEFRFYSGTPGGKPRLEVFYHGAPDTAPEFDDAARLEKYLDERIANARP
jgi:hypothetical protein